MPNPFLVANRRDVDRWLDDELVPLKRSKRSGRIAANPQMLGFALLSNVNKMACYSFGLPAGLTPKDPEGEYPQTLVCPGAPESIKRPRGICNICYAMKGRFVMPKVRPAMQHRLAISLQPFFSDMMVDAILHPHNYCKASPDADPLYMRVHHSGDFYSVAYARQWLKVVETLADMHYPVTLWFPTRVWAMPASRTKQELLPVITDIAAITDNGRPMAVVRGSVLEFDVPPQEVEAAHVRGWAAPTGAFLAGTKLLTMHDIAGKPTGKKRWHADDAVLERMIDLGTWMCPATSTRDTPGELKTCAAMRCRVCWDSPGEHVVYKQH